MNNISLFFVFFIAFISCVYGSNDGFLVLRGLNHDITSIPENNIADLLAHVNGLPPVHQDINRNNFPHTDLFSIPSVNILVAIDSISKETLNNAQTNFLNIDYENTIDMLSCEYPEDSLSTITSALTGEDHSTHGIIGHSWRASKGTSISAFSNNGNCKIPKLSDSISALSDGSSRVVSVSGSQQMAAALGINVELFNNHPEWNCESIYFAKNRGLVSIFSDETVKSNGDIREAAKARSITLKTAEGYMLVAELLAISEIPNYLRNMNNEQSEIPDFIGIGIESIKYLSLKYGENSEQVLEALNLIDNALSEMYSELKSFYQGNIISEIIALKSSTDEHTFYTQNKQQEKLLVKEDENPSSTDDTDTDQYTADDVTAFQTTIWVGIAFIIAAIIGSLALVKMDKLENSLIYKTTDGPRPIQDVQ